MWRCEKVGEQPQPTAEQMGDDSDSQDLPF